MRKRGPLNFRQAPAWGGTETGSDPGPGGRVLWKRQGREPAAAMDRDGEGLAESMFSPGGSGPAQTEAQKEAEKRQQILDEYNMKALSQVVNENELRPVNILRLNVLGGEGKFRDSFLKRQLEPICSQLDDGGQTLTVSKLLKRIDLVNMNLVKTDAISNMGCQLAVPERQPYNVFNPDLLNLVVNMQIVPVKKFFMKIGTNVGNGEGDGYVKLQWKNIFGGGESLDLDTNISSDEFRLKSSRSEYLINYSCPLFNLPDYKFSSVFYHSSRSIDYTSFHNQAIEGLTLKLSTNRLPMENKLNHELSFENLVRSVDLRSSPNASYRNNSLITDYFLFNSGHSFKSSITYSIVRDCRSSRYIFDSGYYMRMSNELSLFSQNKFVKTCFDYSKAHRLSKDMVFNLNLKTGLIHPLANDLVHPMDKFQLGGANDVKGWQVSGMGPKQMNMSVGGNYFHALGLNLFTSVPYFTDSNFKLHFFSNVGKLTNLANAGNILRNNGVSAGFGLSYSHPMAAFELNWVVPISANANDGLRKGLQWGIGVSFL